MPRAINLAVTQMACGKDPMENRDRAESLVRKTTVEGGQVILVRELFESPYFWKDQIIAFFNWAYPAEENLLRERFSKLARELEVVLHVSFFRIDRQCPFQFRDAV